MSKSYKRIETIQVETEYIQCDRCGREAPLVNAIDLWCTTNELNHCYSCQEKYKVGWFSPKTKSIDGNNK